MLFGIDRKHIWISLLILICAFSQITCAQQNAAQKEKERVEQVTRYEESARQFREKGDFQSALREQQKAVELNPDDDESLMLLGGIYNELEQWNKAIEILEKGKRLNPNNAWIHYELAWAFEKSGKKAEGLKEREDSVKLDPENALFIVNLGVAQELSGNNKYARETYNRALRVNSQYIFGLYRLGLLEAEESNIQKAKDLFQRGINAKPIEGGDEEIIRLMKEKLNNLNSNQYNK